MATSLLTCLALNGCKRSDSAASDTEIENSSGSSCCDYAKTVSLPYYRYIMPYGLAKFKRFAENVWDVNTQGKTDEEIACEGLDAMEAWMKELGLIMNIKELGVTEDMLECLVKATLIMEGGYKVLTQDEVLNIFKKSMQ